MNATRVTSNKALVGAAGVHYVVSELSLRGLIALPTMRNTAGIDVVATSRDGSWNANLQIKTSGGKVGFWPVGKSYTGFRGRRNYYVFLRYLRDEQRFQGFLQTSNRVATDVEETAKRHRRQGYKDWGPSWFLGDKQEQSKLTRKWQAFGTKWAV